MKKLFVLTMFFACLHSNLVNAQLINNYGLKLGVTSSEMAFNNFFVPIETERSIGFVGGIFVEWFDNPVFSLLTQVEYTQKGFNEELQRTGSGGPEVIGTETFSNRLDYLSIPISVKVKINSSNITPYFLAGIRIDYLLGYETMSWGVVFDEFNKIVFGGSIGFGIQPHWDIPLTPFFEVRYNIDFTNSYDLNDKTIKGNSFDLLLGLNF